MSKKNKSFQPHNISVKSQNKSPKMADNYKPASSEQNGGKGIEKDLPANMPAMPKLPPELEKKLKDLKDKLDKFKAKVLEKFGDYIVGITLLPPEKAAQAPAPNNEKNSEEKVKEEVKSKEDIKKDEQKIQMLVIVDDTTSTKMTKDELHQKFSTIIQKIAEETDKNLEPQSVLLTDLWQNCYDAKYDLNKLISLGAPIHDTGMLAAIKIAEVHKTMVLKKFEKYILSYVLAGSLTQGRATATSDIDVWIVIDDTDVKKMSRIELKDKLRGIIIGMGIEAGELTGIKNKLNIQVYILTDFWESLKEANPIIFTLLRDGVPFYDRGIFMPWKQLLRMGHIKPSREAIDLFMSTGDQSIKRVKSVLKTIGMEDIYYAILTPSQAALMLYGLPPPTPRETSEVMEEIFVKKEKMLEPEYVKILKDNVDLRKRLEHGDKNDLTGTELDKYITNAEKYLKRISELFKQIEQRYDEKGIILLYDEIMTIIRDVLKQEGVDKVQDEEIIKLFEDELISTGKVPARYLRDLNDIIEAKKKQDAKKLSKADIENARKGSSGLIKFLIEYVQRKRGRELERARIRIKHGQKYGEILLLDKIAFIIFDLDAKEQKIEKAQLNPDGSLGTMEESNLEEMEKDLSRLKFPPKVFIKEPIFEDLKRIFGRDVEVLLSY
ncbi:hypothetical protein J4437_07865 [Candidatus Woesearchaeota archaeon]|nr:hypothetical protein [Candidatus Woesearchaeota archaeon]